MPDLRGRIYKWTDKEGRSVFISYRRDAGGDRARLIKSELEKRRYLVYLDVDVLESDYFDDSLLKHIERARNFVLVLTDGGLDRCVAEGDWLRREIAHAIKMGRNIIPIAKEGYKFPATLPADIAVLARYDIVDHSHRYSRAMMDEIEHRILHPQKRARAKTQDKPKEKQLPPPLNQALATSGRWDFPPRRAPAAVPSAPAAAASAGPGRGVGALQTATPKRTPRPVADVAVTANPLREDGKLSTSLPKQQNKPVQPVAVTRKDQQPQAKAAKVSPLKSTPISSRVTKVSSTDVGRNALCPCGSGKKYKRCHGVGSPPVIVRSSAKASPGKPVTDHFRNVNDSPVSGRARKDAYLAPPPSMQRKVRRPPPG